MAMALLVGGGATTTISALGNCGAPRHAVRRHEFRCSGLRRLSFAQPVARLRVAAPYYGAVLSSPKRRKFVCRAAAATVESETTVKIALPTIPSEATLAKVYDLFCIEGCRILRDLFALETSRIECSLNFGFVDYCQ